MSEVRTIPLRWPKFIGGARDGMPVPHLPPDLRHYEVVKAESRPHWRAAPSVPTDVGYSTETYVLQRLDFAVSGMGIVEVRAWTETSMGQSEAAWRLLCDGLGVPEERR